MTTTMTRAERRERIEEIKCDLLPNVVDDLATYREQLADLMKDIREARALKAQLKAELKALRQSK